MAFWKMAGFEVTPTIPSSIIFWSPPFSMSSRGSSSTQGACPSSRILAKRSFTCSLLSEPFARTAVHPAISVYTPAPRGMRPERCAPVKSSLPSRVIVQTPGISAGGWISVPEANEHTSAVSGGVRRCRNSAKSYCRWRLRENVRTQPAGAEFDSFGPTTSTDVRPYLQDTADYQRLGVWMGEWYVLEVSFIYIHLFAPAAAATASTAGLCASAGRGAVVRVAGPAEELHVVGDHVHGAPLGTVLGLPGAVLQAPLDEDGVTLLLVVGDGLTELAPGGDVEEVDLLAARPHPVDGDPEGADGYTVVGKTQLRVPGHVAGQYDTIEVDHVSFLLLCALQG